MKAWGSRFTQGLGFTQALVFVEFQGPGISRAKKGLVTD